MSLNLSSKRSCRSVLRRADREGVEVEPLHRVAVRDLMDLASVRSEFAKSFHNTSGEWGQLVSECG